MKLSGWALLRFASRAFLVLAITAVSSQSRMHAQEIRGLSVEGYVTASHMPTWIDVNGRHVLVHPKTSYGIVDGNAAEVNSPLRDAVQVGAWVAVVGSDVGTTKTVFARIVYLRADWDMKLSGLGVIDKVISAGKEPVYEADGYRIRITSTTETAFRGEVKSLDNVGPNTWVRYEGKRDADGVLVASKAKFMLVKSGATSTVPGLESHDKDFVAPDFSAHKNGSVKLSLISGFRDIPADRELQDRVSRVGMSVVPEYQRAMADDNPYKVHFSFYAIDDEKLRSNFTTLQGGMILVPRQAIERLTSDTQLAAVLADGVAFVILRQGIKRLIAERVLVGEAAAEIALLAVDPGVGIGLAANLAMGDNRREALMEEQRGRVALSLLSNAGYDPWQAPEAWRLLDPKHLPKDTAALHYPDRAGYQLSILNLQYKKTTAQENPAPAASSDINQK